MVCKCKQMHNIMTKNMTKRFKKDFKRSTTHLITPFFASLVNKTNRRGNPYTIHMVTHWFYGRANNPDIEREYESFLATEKPELITIDMFEDNLVEA